MGLQGALQHMGEPEVQHWMRMVCCRSLAICAGSLQDLLQTHAQKAKGQRAEFQVATAIHLVVLTISACIVPR